MRTLVYIGTLLVTPSLSSKYLDRDYTIGRCPVGYDAVEQDTSQYVVIPTEVVPINTYGTPVLISTPSPYDLENTKYHSVISNSGPGTKHEAAFSESGSHQEPPIPYSRPKTAREPTYSKPDTHYEPPMSYSRTNVPPELAYPSTDTHYEPPKSYSRPNVYHEPVYSKPDTHYEPETAQRETDNYEIPHSKVSTQYEQNITPSKSSTIYEPEIRQPRPENHHEPELFRSIPSTLYDPQMPPKNANHPLETPSYEQVLQPEYTTTEISSKPHRHHQHEPPYYKGNAPISPLPTSPSSIGYSSEISSYATLSTSSKEDTKVSYSSLKAMSSAKAVLQSGSSKSPTTLLTDSESSTITLITSISSISLSFSIMLSVIQSI